jgi:hypothetical protein
MPTAICYKQLGKLLSKSVPQVYTIKKRVAYMTVLQMKPVWELVWVKQGPLKTLSMATDTTAEECAMTVPLSQ